MIAFDPALLPFAAGTALSDKLAVLGALKNQLIGFTRRKEQLIAQPGAVECIVKLAAQSSESEKEILVQLQAVAILGALSLCTQQTQLALARVNAHTSLFNALLDLSTRPPSTSGTKLAESLLRTLKTLYTDIVKVSSQSTATNPARTATHSKGKGRLNAPVPGDEASAAAELSSFAADALAVLYPTTADSSTLPLMLLVDIITAGSVSSEALRMAECACLLLAGTVRTDHARRAVLGEGEEPWRTLEPLMTLAERGTGKVQVSALEALTAILRGATELAHLALHPEMLRFVEALTQLGHSGQPELVIAAATCHTVIFKASRVRPTLGRGGTTVGELDGVLPLVFALLRLLSDEGLPQAGYTLALLISNEPVLQDAAVSHQALKIIYRILTSPLTPNVPYATASSVERAFECAEAMLTVLAAVLSSSEPHRHAAISAQLLPCLLQAISHPSPKVKTASAQALRAISRSPHILRTGLLGDGVAETVFDLIQPHQTESVIESGIALIANLVLDFSPLQQSLVDLGVIVTLGRLVKTGSKPIVIECLFALKNAAFQSKGRTKRQLIDAVGWVDLAILIASDDVQLAEPALALLRNVVCTSDDETEPVYALVGMGEERILSLLCARLVQAYSESMLLHALFCLVNLATEGETTRLAMAARSDLLQATMSHLSHRSPAVRAAAVTVFTNLSSASAARRRPAKEVRERLAFISLRQKLEKMASDSSLDVRERVRDALLVF